MAPSTIPKRKPKKAGKFKRFVQRLCKPLHRKLGSYLETPADMEETRQEIQWFGNDSISQINTGTSNRQPTAQRCEETNESRRSRARYHVPAPVHPVASSQSRRTTRLNYAPNHIDSVRSSFDAAAEIREATVSPEYDAPRRNGVRRVRVSTPKNKDLPGSLRAQPLPLTRSSLDWNSRNVSGAGLINLVPTTPHGTGTRRWQPWEGQLSGQTSRRSTSRNPGLPLEPRKSRAATTRPKPSGNTHHGVIPRPQSHHTSSGSENRRPRSPSELPPGVIPLRDNPNEVLCHSPSRGCMVVRRLLSLESLRQVDVLRKAGSLVGIVEDQRQAVEEISNLTGRMQAERRLRAPVEIVQ